MAEPESVQGDGADAVYDLVRIIADLEALEVCGINRLLREGLVAQESQCSARSKPGHKGSGYPRWELERLWPVSALRQETLTRSG